MKIILKSSFSFLFLSIFIISGYGQKNRKNSVKDIAVLPIVQNKAEAFTKENISLYNVRNFGAKGDSTVIDTDAINKAIEAASAAGGGTVWFPAGKYLSYSIHLKSNITIFLDNGAFLIAANTVEGQAGYDAPEPNAFNMYQDFGHSHWHNSLIWGEDLENIAITGTWMDHRNRSSENGKGNARPWEQSHCS